jgi:hypothetical protein
VIGHIEPLVRQVADARGEAESQRVAQGEDVIGEAVGVGVVLFDAQVRFMVEQPIEDPALKGARSRPVPWR